MRADLHVWTNIAADDGLSGSQRRVCPTTTIVTDGTLSRFVIIGYYLKQQELPFEQRLVQSHRGEANGGSVGVEYSFARFLFSFGSDDVEMGAIAQPT